MQKMRTYHSSAICPKCGAVMRTGNAKNYNFSCDCCKGRFRSNSIKESSDDIFSISISARPIDFETHEKQLLELSDKYNCSFFGYDDMCFLIDIGWENGYPEYQVMYSFLKEVNEIIGRITL